MMPSLNALSAEIVLSSINLNSSSKVANWISIYNSMVSCGIRD